MSDFDTDIAALQADPRMGNRVDPIKHFAGLFVGEYVYTVDASEVEDDRIRIAKMPVRSKLVTALCSVVNDAVGGTSAIISVGTSGNADKYASALDITAAGKDDFGVSGDVDVDPEPITSEDDQWIYATLTTLTAAMTAGKKIKFTLVFAAVS